MSYSVAEKNKKRAYQPDLLELQTHCELNYWLVKQLLPHLIDTVFCLKTNHTTNEKTNESELSPETYQNRTWSLSSDSVKLMFEVTQAARYTTTLNLMIKTPKIEITHANKLIIRFYHDAQMMEVMEGTGPSAMQAIYPEDNSNKNMVDEKQQVNRFIGECLRACLKATQNQAASSWG